ncbi:MAG TPA: serine/threonine-protein kinase, partial [Polyangiaceae bacterium]
MASPSSSGSLTPPDGDLPVRLGGYNVVRRLATGGTSDVLLARAEGPHGFERVVVLKVLLQQFREDEKFERMFAREAAAYARLSHPAIVKLYDFFSDAGQLVMVLEYVDGLPLHKLRALLRPSGKPLDDRASMFVASRIFGALSAAHSARDPATGEFSPVIHRDVNPSNVLIPWDGHVKIADFGIAKVAGISGDTQAGFIKGTYGYMAPEQVRGEAVTVRTDVYAACLLFWELLAGRKAIVRGSSSDLEVLRAMAEPKFPALAALRPDLPGPLLDAIERGLQPDPDRRAITADELFGALRAATNLDAGRRVLIDALAGVRPAATPEDLAITTSRASVLPVPRAPDSAEATIPNQVALRGAPSQADDTITDLPRLELPDLPVVKTPPPPRPTKPLASTLRMSSAPPRPAPLPPAPPPRTPPPGATLMGISPSRPPSTPPPARTAPSVPPPRVAPSVPPPRTAPSVPPPPRMPPPAAAPFFAATPPPAPVAWTPPPPVARSEPVADVDLEPPRGGRGWVAGVVALVGVALCAGVVLVVWARGHASAAYSPPPRTSVAKPVATTTTTATVTATTTATVTAT